MRNELIGIIAEGKEDQDVIKNILRAFGFDGKTEVRYIRPSLSYDATALSNQQTIGTLQGVKNSCIQRTDFDRAFIITGINYMVIQMDTAEIENQDFEFKRPPKTKNLNYASELRGLCIDKINEWLQNNYENQLFYAITIEETEAWLLTIFEKSDSTKSANPKQKLFHDFREHISGKSYDVISKPFSKLKDLIHFAKNNSSLKVFVEQLEEKLHR